MAGIARRSYFAVQLADFATVRACNFGKQIVQFGFQVREFAPLTVRDPVCRSFALRICQCRQRRWQRERYGNCAGDNSALVAASLVGELRLDWLAVAVEPLLSFDVLN